MTLSLQFSLSIALAGILSSSLSAQHIGGETTLAYFNAGASTSDELGEEVLGPGDLDGDGIADYVVADLGYDSDRGRVRARSGATGLTIWVVEGEDLNDHFGHAMAAMGDLDGDGVPDIAVSAPYNDSGAWNGGEICTLSGATGSRIWSVGSPTTNRYLGKAMAAADVNGDGYKDAIAGMPDADNGVYIEAGKISAYSGFGGSFLGDQYGTGSDRRLGSSVAGLSDINGDGCDEVVVSAPRRDSGGHTDNGRVSIFSGAVLTGASGTLVLDRVSGGQTGEEFGTSVANAGDVDGDGYDDFLVGAQFYDDSLGNADVGRVSLISGSTFAELASFEDPSPAESTNFGRTVAGGGDVDHDGIPDLLIGAPGWEIGYNNAAGAVFAFSGRTFELLIEVRGDRSYGLLGTGLANIGDVNGDGTAEFIAGAPHASSLGMTRAGVAYTYGIKPYLTISETEASGGDSVSLDIDFPDADGRYQILISRVSAGPTTIAFAEVPIGPVMVPFGSAGYPPFTNQFVGRPDADGKASASLDLPVGIPPMTLYFAAVQAHSRGIISRTSIVQVLEVF